VEERNENSCASSAPETGPANLNADAND